MDRKKEANVALISGRLFTLIGFGGWFVTTFVLNSLDRVQSFMNSIDSIFGDEAHIIYTLVEYAEQYGIYIGITGIVLLIIGYSIKKNEPKNSI